MSVARVPAAKPVSPFARYSAFCKAQPLLSAVLTGLGVMMVGDTVAQAVEARLVGTRGRWMNWERFSVVVSWSAVNSVFFLVWFGALDRRFPGSSVRAVMLKAAINQVFVSVPLNFAFLVWSTSLQHALKSRSRDGGGPSPLADLRAKVELAARERLPTIVAGSFCFWPVVNGANFLLVPPHMRVLPTVLGSFAWSSFLTFVAHVPPQLLPW